MKRLNIFLLLVVAVILAACGSDKEAEGSGSNSGSDKVYKLKVAHSSAATNDRLENSLQEFKKSIEESSDGRISIETYPNSQLGGEREALEGVQNGSIEMAVISTGPFAGFSKAMMVLDLPYIFKDSEQAFSILDGEFGDELFEKLNAETGMRGLGWGENGIRHVANNTKEVLTPQDMKGLKIRTQENQAHMDMIKAFGGNATPIAFNELYSSLQQGVIDGYENPFSLIVGMKFYEVTKYMTLTNHVFGAYAFVINDDVYNSMPEDLQEILAEEVAKWEQVERKMNQDQEIEGRKVMEEHGVKITELTDEQYEEFQKLAQPVTESYREVVGEETYDSLMEKLGE
ncbi:TRAP-type C4-dicarboxylate transport system, periplasmic component [Bacillus sp. OxB-1]|uniref:TRAP transporter substrate-binding protein n=1 Tax=Bacillus sp. (strain OxB-1) TaxID=98228 RepID=UPI000581BBBB|nr:DctP family TRAP transporter solute-binding subunit [Bacillus sp. OxB-1]BAQ09342.1 TRAP-type C4-dicarboxylate transport system, periplasmic component [Bacillus sp. OxB-1]